MASTFSSAQHFVGPISDNYRIGIQCGQSTGSSAPALAEMKWITMEEFKTYARQGLGNMANYRGAYSDALPENAVQNDYFNATATFTVSGVTYTSGHVYEYNGSTWGDVTGIFAQFCTLQQAIAAAQSQINELALLKTQLAQALSADEDKVPSNKCVNDAINAISTQVASKAERKQYSLPNGSTLTFYTEDDYTVLVDVYSRTASFKYVVLISGYSVGADRNRWVVLMDETGQAVYTTSDGGCSFKITNAFGRDAQLILTSIGNANVIPPVI